MGIETGRQSIEEQRHEVGYGLSQMFDGFMERPDFEGTDGRVTDIPAKELGQALGEKFEITLEDADVSTIDTMLANTGSRDELFEEMTKLVLEMRERKEA